MEISYLQICCVWPMLYLRQINEVLVLIKMGIRNTVNDMNGPAKSTITINVNARHAVASVRCIPANKAVDNRRIVNVVLRIVFGR